jgi:hypothetical protein
LVFGFVVKVQVEVEVLVDVKMVLWELLTIAVGMREMNKKVCPIDQ